MKDISGEQFGLLTVLEKAEGKSKSGELLWLCECQCGTRKVIVGTKLRNGRTKSCGCKSTAKIFDGEVFGKLTVIGDTGKRTKSGNQIVICRHENGIIKEYSSATLTSGKASGWSGSDEHLSKLKTDIVEGTRIRNLTRKVNKTSSTGIKGVSHDKKHNTWRATLLFKGKTVLNKRFKTKEEAVNARLEAEEKYVKPFLDDFHQKN